MAITRKPQKRAGNGGTPVDIEALINRGGSAATTPPPEAAKPSTPILLRIPGGMMEQLDVVLKARPVKLPRHTWILEAIHEKLSRELPTPGPKS
jgi:hypothetical protein